MRFLWTAGPVWTGIVGLAWWLADRRIALCETANCEVRATGDRDFALLAGLTVLLVAAMAVAFVRGRLDRPQYSRPVDVTPKAWFWRSGYRRSSKVLHLLDAQGRSSAKSTSGFRKIALASLPFALLMTALFGAALQTNKVMTENIMDNYEAAADNLEAAEASHGPATDLIP